MTSSKEAGQSDDREVSSQSPSSTPRSEVAPEFVENLGAKAEDTSERDTNTAGVVWSLRKAARFAGQVSAIVGAVAATFSLIGGLWIAAAAAMIPGGGESLSGASLTGLITLVAIGGMSTSLVAVGALGFSGYSYGIMFAGADKIKPSEKALYQPRFLPELVLFASLPIAAVIVFRLLSLFPFGWRHLWASGAVISVALFPPISSAILHARVNEKDGRSSLASRLLRTLFAALTFGIPAYFCWILVLSAQPLGVPATIWIWILPYIVLSFIVNYAFAIGNVVAVTFAIIFTLATIFFADYKAIITTPLRLYHMIDFEANLVVASGKEDTVRHSFADCPSVEKQAINYAPHKFALTYNVQVLNAIGDSYVVKCGSKESFVILSKSLFGAAQW